MIVHAFCLLTWEAEACHLSSCHTESKFPERKGRGGLRLVGIHTQEMHSLVRLCRMDKGEAKTSRSEPMGATCTEGYVQVSGKALGGLDRSMVL